MRFSLSTVLRAHDPTYEVEAWATSTFGAAVHRRDVMPLHRARHGLARQSYGIEVARLAGLPQDVLTAARERLMALEDRHRQAAVPAQGHLFTLAADAAQCRQRRPLQRGCGRWSRISSRHGEALAALYELHGLAKVAVPASSATDQCPESAALTTSMVRPIGGVRRHTS